jgi:hypothetical protein
VYLFGLLEAFDVGTHPVPHGYLPSFVAEWFEANQKPAKAAIMAPHARFNVACCTGGQQLPPFVHQ